MSKKRISLFDHRVVEFFSDLYTPISIIKCSCGKDFESETNDKDASNKFFNHQVDELNKQLVEVNQELAFSDMELEVV